MAWPFTRWAFQIPAESNSSALIAQTNSSGRNRSNRANTLLKIRAADRQRTMTVNAAETATATATATATETLQKGIAEFYDESSGVWEDIWGDHMHHGFYKPGSNVSLSDHRSAQIRMIEESLRYASLADSVEKLENIVDVGCGMGGSSRYLARKYGSTCEGITLSPLQAQRAQALADAQGLGDKVSFQVADALNQPFQDGQFDLVWSMESGEHMPDKTKFVNELARVAAPGGTIIIVTWLLEFVESNTMFAQRKF